MAQRRPYDRSSRNERKNARENSRRRPRTRRLKPTGSQNAVGQPRSDGHTGGTRTYTDDRKRPNRLSGRNVTPRIPNSKNIDARPGEYKEVKTEVGKAKSKTSSGSGRGKLLGKLGGAVAGILTAGPAGSGSDRVPNVKQTKKPETVKKPNVGPSERPPKRKKNLGPPPSSVTENHKSPSYKNPKEKPVKTKKTSTASTKTKRSTREKTEEMDLNKMTLAGYRHKDLVKLRKEGKLESEYKKVVGSSKSKRKK